MILSVAVGGVLALLNAVLLRVKSAQRDLFYDSKERMYTAKMFSLDYTDVDNQEARGLLSIARQNENWAGWGFIRLIEIVEEMSKAAVGVLSAIVLSVKPVHPAGFGVGGLVHRPQ